jgi:hypothetical protein
MKRQIRGTLSWDPSLPTLGLYSPTLLFSISINSPTLHLKKKLYLHKEAKFGLRIMCYSLPTLALDFCFSKSDVVHRPSVITWEALDMQKYRPL